MYTPRSNTPNSEVVNEAFIDEDGNLVDQPERTSSTVGTFLRFNPTLPANARLLGVLTLLEEPTPDDRYRTLSIPAPIDPWGSPTASNSGSSQPTTPLDLYLPDLSPPDDATRDRQINRDYIMSTDWILHHRLHHLEGSFSQVHMSEGRADR